MKLTEFINNNFYDPTNDKKNIRNLDDTRKPVLTLKHLNKLRKMREVKKLDMLKRQKDWKRIYGTPPAEEGGMPEF